MRLIDVDGRKVLAIELQGFKVAEFTIAGAAAPSEVHVMLETDMALDAEDLPIGLRFTGPDSLRNLIGALLEHGRAVFGEAATPPGWTPF